MLGKNRKVNVKERPFQVLSDREKIQAICEVFGTPYYEPLDKRNKNVLSRSLFIADRRYMFDSEGQIKNILDYEDRKLPQWVKDVTG